MSKFRADHCGSLIRPINLRNARKEFIYGRISREQLHQVEDDAILQALSLQKSAGVDIYSDGEFRRHSWVSAISEDFFDGLKDEGVDYVRYPYLKDKSVLDAKAVLPPNPVVVGKLKLKKRITGQEIDFLKARAPGPFKITLPSPVTLSRGSYVKGKSDAAYPTWKSFFDDYTALLAQEIKSIVRDGVKYIQLDAPHYFRFIVPDRRKQLTDLGIDLEQELRDAIDAENKCLRAARGDGVNTAVHICLGTFIFGAQGPLGGAGDYDEDILSRLFRELDADTFLIEYSERSGGLDTLRNAPKDKTYCLGILNVRDPRVETVDEIRRKVDIAAKYVPLDNLTLSPNCGFSGLAADAFVDEEIEKRKLSVLAEAAHKIWPQ